ncbi:MAG TPA: type IV pili methyl-accepting chemotaxis transducer N-terminal domain-containing protein [Polyangiaceae bacterium]|nr:type IV pili methyl-accepting chemotaxis transducer N-terminal domain-containing protein [Polyangiaceae bacterium]
MWSTIQGRLLAILFGFLFLVGAGALASHVLLDRQTDDSLLVNLAGRQRMLTQKMAKEATQLALLRREQGEGTRVTLEQRDQLVNSMRVFEMTLFALRDGGPAPLNLEITRVRQTPSASSSDITRQLDRVVNVWKPFKAGLNTLIRTDGSDAAALHSVLETNLTLLEQMNLAVNLMQQDSERRVYLLFWVQLSLLVASVALGIAGLWVARSSIARPLEELTQAAHHMSTGDLRVELPREGTREIQDLSASFERMRTSMLATLGGARYAQDPLDDLL